MDRAVDVPRKAGWLCSDRLHLVNTAPTIRSTPPFVGTLANNVYPLSFSLSLIHGIIAENPGRMRQSDSTFVVGLSRQIRMELENEADRHSRPIDPLWNRAMIGRI